MILQLDIEKLERGLYEARCEHHAPATTVHDSISAVLKYYGEDIPDNFCRFVEVRYGGVSLGTTAVTALAKEPEVLAGQLTSLLAAVYQATEDMEKTAQTH
jgi:hypothetical protein